MPFARLPHEPLGEDKDHDRGQGRQRDRHNDLEKDLHFGGPIDFCGFCQLFGN